MIDLTKSKKATEARDSAVDTIRLLDALPPGTWLNLPYGFSRKNFYVLSDLGDRVLVSTPRWLVSSSETLEKEYLARVQARVIGRTKRRWWWKFLPWRDCICPFAPIQFV